MESFYCREIHLMAFGTFIIHTFIQKNNKMILDVVGIIGSNNGKNWKSIRRKKRFFLALRARANGKPHKNIKSRIMWDHLTKTWNNFFLLSFRLVKRKIAVKANKIFYMRVFISSVKSIPFQFNYDVYFILIDSCKWLIFLLRLI